MKKLSYILMSLVFISTAFNAPAASAASTYTLNLSVYESEGFMGLFLDHGNASQLVDFKNEVKRMAGIDWDKTK